MSLKINHNVNHLKAVHKIEETSKNLKVSNDRLASGVAASAAVDGGAVLSLTERLRADIAGLNQASQNTEAAFSLVQVAESSLVEVSERIRHLRALAVQASDAAILDTEGRHVIQEEVEKALESIDQIANSSQFGSKKLFDGSASMQARMEGDGFNFIEGVATTDQELNKPQNIVIQQSATRNTTLGEVAFADVLEHEETIILSDKNQQAIFTAIPGKSVEENLAALQKTVREAGVNVSVSLEGGALRITHNEYGSKHVFRVQSETPGLLVGGDDENTEARIRRDVEEGVLERDKVTEFLTDAALIGLDVATGAGAVTIILKNTPAFKGLQEDLIRASKEGLKSIQQSALQQLELLNEFDFIVPSKFALQPQAIIRLNQKQIVDYGIALVNRKEGLNSLSLGDFAEKVLDRIDVDQVVSSQSQSTSEKMQQLLHKLSTSMSEQLSAELIDGLRFLLGTENSQKLVLPIQRGVPALLESVFNNIGLSVIENNLPPNATNQEIYDFVREKFPDFIDDFNVRGNLENMIGILDPLEPRGGVVDNDFKMNAESVDSAFVNNGRNTIGFFDREFAVGDGRTFTGTRKLAGVYLRYDGVLEPGDTAEGQLIIEDPGLSFQVGNLASHQALFGLPSISSFQLGQGIPNSSSYQSLADIDFSTSEGASDAIALLDAANEEITVLRGLLGTFGGALGSNVTSLQNLADESTAAETQVSGTDHAQEIASKIQNQIQMDYQSAVITHSNISSDNVLRLLDIA